MRESRREALKIAIQDPPTPDQCPTGPTSSTRFVDFSHQNTCPEILMAGLDDTGAEPSKPSHSSAVTTSEYHCQAVFHVFASPWGKTSKRLDSGPLGQDLCICPVDTYRPCWDVDAENGTALRSECTCPTSFYLPASQARNNMCTLLASAFFWAGLNGPPNGNPQVP